MNAQIRTVIALAAATLVVGCAPKKNPKPDVSASSEAATAAANEGMAAAAPSAAFNPGSVTPAEKGEATSGALPVLGPAPDWTLKDVNGNAVSSSQFKGKVVVLDFWATWCPPCRSEIPGYVDLAKKYGKDLAIVGVSLDQDGPAVVKRFIEQFHVGYPIVMGDDTIQQAYGGMEAIPTTFLIDRQGRIRDKKVGAEPTEAYEKKIVSLIQ